MKKWILGGILLALLVGCGGGDGGDDDPLPPPVTVNPPARLTAFDGTWRNLDTALSKAAAEITTTNGTAFAGDMQIEIVPGTWADVDLANGSIDTSSGDLVFAATGQTGTLVAIESVIFHDIPDSENINVEIRYFGGGHGLTLQRSNGRASIF